LIIKRNSNNNKFDDQPFWPIYTNEPKRLSKVKTIDVMCGEGGIGISKYYYNSSGLYIADAFQYYYDTGSQKFVAYEVITNEDVRKNHENPKRLQSGLLKISA